MQKLNYCYCFRVDTFLPIVDKLTEALTCRREAYLTISSKFAFRRRLISMTVDEIDVLANFLVETYSADLDNDLATELNFFA